MRELDKEVASGRMRLPEGLGNDEFVRRRHRVHLGAAYADEIWLPVSMDYLSLQGARQVVESVQMIREELDHVVTVRYVIPTFYDVRNAKTKAVSEALTTSFGAAVTSPVRANVRLSEAPSYHQSIFDYAPQSTGAEDFRTLVRSILADEAQKPARR